MSHIARGLEMGKGNGFDPCKFVWVVFVFLVAVAGYGLSWYWFGWRLSLVLLLVLYAHNLDRHCKEL